MLHGPERVNGRPLIAAARRRCQRGNLVERDEILAGLPGASLVIPLGIVIGFTIESGPDVIHVP